MKGMKERMFLKKVFKKRKLKKDYTFKEQAMHSKNICSNFH